MPVSCSAPRGLSPAPVTAGHPIFTTRCRCNASARALPAQHLRGRRDSAFLRDRCHPTQLPQHQGRPRERRTTRRRHTARKPPAASAPKTTPTAASAPSATPGPQDPPRRRSEAAPNRITERLEALLGPIDHDIERREAALIDYRRWPESQDPGFAEDPFADRRGPVPAAAARPVGHRRRGRRSSSGRRSTNRILPSGRDRPHLRLVEDLTTTDDGTLVDPVPDTRSNTSARCARRTSTASNPCGFGGAGGRSMSRFQPKASRHSSRRIAITGPSGAGKTLHRRSSPRPFRVMGAPSSSTASAVPGVRGTPTGGTTTSSTTPQTTTRFQLAEAIAEASRHLTSVIVIDPVARFWEGGGGKQDIADNAGHTSGGGNRFAGWKVATPASPSDRHNPRLPRPRDLHDAVRRSTSSRTTIAARSSLARSAWRR